MIKLRGHAIGSGLSLQRHTVESYFNAGDVVGIEVKASTSADLEDFRHLKWFKENLQRPRKKFIGVVLYTGNHVSSLGDGMWAIPISTLY